MAVLLTEISLEWLETQNACNIELLREYFSEHPTLPLTAPNILRAAQAGILSSNWLAKRVLTGDDLATYDTEMKKQYAIFERHMAPFLAKLILTARRE